MCVRFPSTAVLLSLNQVAVRALPQRERDGLPRAFCFENFQRTCKILQYIIICGDAGVCMALLSSLLEPAVVFARFLLGERVWCLGLCSRRPRGGGQDGGGTREESQSQSQSQSVTDLQTHVDVTSSVSCFMNI